MDRHRQTEIDRLNNIDRHRQTDGLTDHGLYNFLHVFDHGLIDPHGQVTEHLSVLRQVKVPQTVLILSGRVLRLERLQNIGYIVLNLSLSLFDFLFDTIIFLSCTLSA